MTAAGTNEQAPPGQQRVLVLGARRYWGRRTLRHLAVEADVALSIGAERGPGPSAPNGSGVVTLGPGPQPLADLLEATGVDTVIHGALVTEAGTGEAGRLHDLNVVGTLELLSALASATHRVRQVVVVSSAAVYGVGPRDPTFFAEDHRRRHPSATTKLQRSLVEAETYLGDVGAEQGDLSVSILRFADPLGPGDDSPLGRVLALPAIPAIVGFDPGVQFTDHDDVLGAIDFARRHRLHGVFNVAGAGRLPWSEVAAVMGRPRWPLPSVLTPAAARGLSVLTGVRLDGERLALLRYGRGVDTTRITLTGFSCRHSSSAALERFAREHRLRRWAPRSGAGATDDVRRQGAGPGWP